MEVGDEGKKRGNGQERGNRLTPHQFGIQLGTVRGSSGGY